MDDLSAFHTDLQQEVLARLSVAEEGAFQEEVFTDCLLERLEETGHTAGALVCTDIRQNKGGATLHKVNGYALNQDNESETLDLFVSRYYPPTTDGADDGAPQPFGKADLERAATQATAFLTTALKGYVDQLDPSAPAYQLAWHLDKNEEKLLRARVIILTNGRSTGAEVPPDQHIRQVLVHYELWDINRFHRLFTSNGQREPLDINFEATYNQPIRCLPMPVAAEGYQTLLAIMPGTILADLYQEHGQRLLERNVRAFLQFSTKVNRGIQETILKEPERFLAYNNGLAVTAAEVELTADGTAIRRIRDLQIVNGGQTTAAICQTRHRLKDAPLDHVFVQMKLTVLPPSDDSDAFVSLIAQFANTQNAIKQTDLSANTPFNVALEKLSRTIWAPALTGTGNQTHWFFERARGQYQTELARGLTPAGRKKVMAQNPKAQVISKDMMAKARLAWEQQPEVVVRGGEKVYAAFRRDLKPGQLPNQPWFEDLIALQILWREADSIYTRNGTLRGTKFLAVPYTLAWLSRQTGGAPDSTRLNLPAIWKQQGVSSALRELLLATVPAVDAFIQQSRPATVALVQEWAKKPECWEAFRHAGNLDLAPQLAAVLAERLPPNQIEPRYRAADDTAALKALEIQQLRDEVADLGHEAWKRIYAWGRQPGADGHPWLTPNQLSVTDRATSPRSLKALTELELRSAHRVIDLLLEHQPDLLFDLEELAPGQPASATKPNPTADLPITLELVEALRQWDRKAKFFRLESADFLGQIARGKLSLSNAHVAGKVRFMVSRAIPKGFFAT